MLHLINPSGGTDARIGGIPGALLLPQGISMAVISIIRLTAPQQGQTFLESKDRLTVETRVKGRPK